MSDANLRGYEEPINKHAAGTAVMIIVLAASVSTLLIVVPGGVRASTLHVGGIGPGNYTTIQEALDAANTGDIVYVYNGTYYEYVTIRKSISLIGENRSTTAIHNTVIGLPTISVAASWVNVSGFTVTSDDWSDGISLGSVNNVSITNNFLADDRYGITCYLSNDTVISNNIISSNTAEGIFVGACLRLTALDNVMLGNGIGISGEDVEEWTSHTIGTSNTVNGKPVYYWKNVVGGTVPPNAGEVIIGNSTDVVVERQNFTGVGSGVIVGFSSRINITGNSFISNSGVAITLSSTSGSTIANNTILDSGGSMSLSYSDGNIVRNNTVSRNGWGLYLSYSHANSVNLNNITSNTKGGSQGRGISLYRSYRNAIEGNLVGSNFAGIYVVLSTRNRVANNTVVKHQQYSVQVEQHSDYTTMVNNTVNDGSIIFSDSDNNTIMDNDAQWIGLTLSDDNLVQGSPGDVGVGGMRNLVRNNSGSINVGGSWNTISNNTGSISVGGSHNMVVNNTVERSGIRISGADNTTVAGNKISKGSEGVYIYWSDGNAILNNTLRSNGIYGVFLNASNNNVISGNVVIGSHFGIYVRWLSTNVTVKDNTVMNNDYGVYFVVYSYGNRVYHNDIVNNTNQASQDANNTWDDGYPFGGNYWSDYGGIDSYSGPNQDVPGSDGIGDTPYVIGDRYPLMRQLKPVPVTPSAPLNLQATGGNANVTLTWSPPNSDGGSTIANFELYRGGYLGGEVFVEEVGDILSYVDIGLKNGWTYCYRVSARNAAEEGPRSNDACATPSSIPRAPGPPVGLVAMAGDTQVTLTWSPPTDTGGSPISNYRIHRGLSPSGEVQIAEVGNVSTYIDAGLTNGQTYYYKVSAKNAAGEGQRSNEANATPTGIPTFPGPPTGLIAIGANKQITLSWSLPVSDGGSPVTNYTIYRGTVSGGESFLAQIGSNRNYVDTSLPDGQTYYYQVTARNTIGEGQRSNEANATTWTIPGPPNSLAGVAGNGQVALTWLPPTSNGGSSVTSVTNYRIYRGTMAGGEALLIELGNVLTYLDGGLANGQRYYYRVAAKNAVGEGSMSSEVWAVPATIPGAPTSLNAVEGDRQVTLTWTAPADDGGSAITNYMVYRGTAAGAESFLTQLGPSTSYVDNGLTNGETYYYEVSAVNAVGEGSQSNEAVATPVSPVAPPSAPGNLTAVPGDKQIALTWAAPSSDGGSPITNYRIYGGTTPGGESLLVEAGTVLTHVVAGLANGQTYYYQVTALNSVGESPRSVEVSATPTTPFTNYPPTCNIIAPVLYETAVGSHVVAGIANDIDGTVQRVEVKIDDGSWIVASGTTSWLYTWDTVAVVNGHHTITARSFDGVNYSADVSVTVNVDNQPLHPPGETSILEQPWFWVLLAVVIAETILLVLPLLNKWRGRATARKEEPEEEETAERPVKEKEE